jgi:hypothetical protein
MYKHPESGKPKMLVTTPDKVIRIHNKDELKGQLQHYSLGGGGAVVFLRPNSPFTKFQYVTKIRPALRYYCAKFNVPIPEWLTVASDDKFTELSDTDQLRLFGKKLPRVREFTKIRTKLDEGEGHAASQP